MKRNYFALLIFICITPYQLSSNIPNISDELAPRVFITEPDFGSKIARQIQLSSGVNDASVFTIVSTQMQKLRNKLVGDEGNNPYIRLGTFLEGSTQNFPHEFGAFDPKGRDGFGDGKQGGREQYRTRVPALLWKGVYTVNILSEPAQEMSLSQKKLLSINKGGLEGQVTMPLKKKINNIYLQIIHDCIENGQSKPSQYGEKILVGNHVQFLFDFGKLTN